MLTGAHADRRAGRREVYKRRGIDLMFGGPGQFLLTGKTAAMLFATLGIVTAAGAVHARKWHAAIFTPARWQAHPNRRRDISQHGGRDKTAAKRIDRMMAEPAIAHAG